MNNHYRLEIFATETARLDPEVKAKWVAALRSGDYVQGRQVLRKREDSGETKYCCLGVLCNILAPKGWCGDAQMFTQDIFSCSETSYLPKWLIGQAVGDADLSETKSLDTKLRGCLLGYTKYGRIIDLTDLNDDGFTFSQIADVIEYFF